MLTTIQSVTSTNKGFLRLTNKLDRNTIPVIYYSSIQVQTQVLEINY